MPLNTTVITTAHWQAFPAPLRAALRRALRRKLAIVNHQVLAVAQALCGRGAYDVPFALYQALDGQPPIPYQGCGLGLLMNPRDLMGEDPAPIGETLALREEEQR
jgi:hypothetical protein